MGALDDFYVALLHLADILNRSDYLRRWGGGALFAFKPSKSDFLSAQITWIPKLKNEKTIRREKWAYCCLPEVHQMLSHISLTFLTWLSANLGEHTLFPRVHGNRNIICIFLINECSSTVWGISGKLRFLEAEDWTEWPRMSIISWLSFC